ncbi:hypothetical protein DFR86_11490 [Acidianus sulfidivorans JP7]|uniref:Uncharacterized protein n=1 Tax=Acidianus sulfidivorans JP7 TaxID=619593 RepID=A0A2U9IQ44_9CREN|nr:hypothetical protein [Acidianus sulfidivorans]AWR98094.1 hypothetical protein DFR86_11490 [Acidianus sulfidivorans JP7]
MEAGANLDEKFFQDGLEDLKLVQKAVDMVLSKEERNRIIFLLASAAEKISKGLLIFYPAALLKPLNTEQVNLQVLCKLKDIIDLSQDIQRIKKELSHKPITESGITELVETLIEITSSEKLRKDYEAVLEYLKNVDQNPKERRYNEVEELINRINNNDELDFFSQLFLSVMIITSYLQHAAGSIARYSVGRDEKDEEYLEDINRNLKDIILRLGSTEEIFGENKDEIYLNEVMPIYRELSEELVNLISSRLKEMKK